MSRDPGPPEPRRGGSCKIGRDPVEDGSVPAPLPRRCALRRPSHGRATRSPRPPKPPGSRPDVARSRPPRATARGIPQNWARSGRRRVGTRPPPTSVRSTQGDARPRNPTPPAPETAWISTGCREIQALPSHGEGDPAKSGEIRAKTGRYPPLFHVGAPYAGRRTAAQPDPLGPRNRLDLDRMSRDPGPSEPWRGGSCKIRRDPGEYGSVPAHLPRRCALYAEGQAVIPPHNPTHSAPETAWISTGCREIQALPSHNEGDPPK